MNTQRRTVREVDREIDGTQGRAGLPSAWEARLCAGPSPGPVRGYPEITRSSDTRTLHGMGVIDATGDGVGRN